MRDADIKPNVLYQDDLPEALKVSCLGGGGNESSQDPPLPIENGQVESFHSLKIGYGYGRNLKNRRIFHVHSGTKC
eukprot:scaffold7175_cov49-Cylindrotheca_fusiformis.AAC.2